jgi:CheY-like chemotaxis protein
MPDLPRGLVDEFAVGNGLLWIGAGSSAGSGLPCWDDLIAGMRRRIAERGEFSEDELKRSLNNLETAQLFRTVEGDYSYQRFLEDRMRNVLTTAARNPTLLAIASLINRMWPDPGLVVVSTNFDTLLEDTMMVRHGKKPRKVITNADIGFLNEAKDLVVIKPNGDIENPQSIVFTMQDYYEYRVAKSEFSRFIEGQLRTKTFLFVGYSLSDFTFNSMLGDIQASLGRFRRRAYAIAKKESAARSKVLESIGIEVIPVASHDAIPALLDGITVQINQTAESLAAFVSETLRDTTFLLIDDELAFIESVKNLYQGYGWTGLTAVTRIEDAVKAMREQQFDFILTDLEMENSALSGLKVITFARATEKNANSILAVWSQHVDPDKHLKCLEAGADEVFSKHASVRETFLRLFALKRLRDRAYTQSSRAAQARTIAS